MKNFLHIIDRHFNGLIINLLVAGVLLLIFSVLVVWVDFVLELVVGMALLMVAWILFYAAYKLYYLKKHLKDLLPRI
ncbi:MAG: hypothetical protein Q8Q23_03205 [bacterium]|nr:hypothetical protein [bacterium]